MATRAYRIRSEDLTHPTVEAGIAAQKVIVVGQYQNSALLLVHGLTQAQHDTISAFPSVQPISRSAINRRVTADQVRDWINLSRGLPAGYVSRLSRVLAQHITQPES